ncbi:MAG TPA: sulfatase-like hydrolase/transferase, partial [Sumerlaeia bacterium]|nr:sulfatase-like hydrolase/transferase [Sumerlaeia bacterium]
MNRPDRSRRRFLKALSSSATALGISGGGEWAFAETSRRTRPNVLFLFTDDQRADTVGALGNPHIQTPNLDRLVESGFVFRNAYCMGGFSAAVCLPSRMMTLRGRSWFSVRDMPKDAPNFPKSMNAAGYVSYHLGKRGNTDQESHQSFAHNHYLEPKDIDVLREGRPGRQLADRSIQFLRDYMQSAEAREGKPFFM